MRNEYNFLNSFWMKKDTDSVGYCRIRMWNRIEKTNDNRIRMYPLCYHIKFEYGYGYPYWRLSGYGYQIIRISAIRFPPLIRQIDHMHASSCPYTSDWTRADGSFLSGASWPTWSVTIPVAPFVGSSSMESKLHARHAKTVMHRSLLSTQFTFSSVTPIIFRNICDSNHGYA